MFKWKVILYKKKELSLKKAVKEFLKTGRQIVDTAVIWITWVMGM